MKPEKVYQALKDLAEKLDIIVTEKSFCNAGVNVKSGLCKVKGEKLFIMNKHNTIYEKNIILASCLMDMDHEDIYVVPAVRDLLNKKEKK